MNTLLLLERAVIESIAKGNKTAQEISKDLDLTSSWISSLLHGLCQKGLLEFNGNNYCLGVKEKFSMVNQEKSLKSEIKELINSLVDGHFSSESKTGIKLRKVHMNNHEQAIYSTLLTNLEQFIEGLKPVTSSKTSDYQVVFWANSTYGSLMEDYLRNNY